MKINALTVMKKQITKKVNKIKQMFCEHDLYSDKWLTVVRCSKCEKEYWYKYKNLFNKKGRYE